MSSENEVRISVVLTTFNRREMTLSCLQALQASADAGGGVRLKGFLVDDKSPDGTVGAVQEAFPWVTCISSQGNLFWNRGMHCAMQHAISDDAFDYILWINDDTCLTLGALAELIHVSEQSGGTSVVVGSIFDKATHQLTYGGQRRKRKRLSFERIFETNAPFDCDTMNGNLVLIPKLVVDTVGNLDPVFEHAMGDLDYGLRARGRGFRVVATHVPCGYCSRNPTAGTFEDVRLGLKARLKSLSGRKALPYKSWLHFTMRHGGLLWPAYFVWPYLKTVCSGLLGPRAK